MGKTHGSAGCSELFEQVLTRLASRKELREDMSSEAIQLPQGTQKHCNKIYVFIYIHIYSICIVNVYRNLKYVYSMYMCECGSVCVCLRVCFCMCAHSLMYVIVHTHTVLCIATSSTVTNYIIPMASFEWKAAT